MAGSLILSGHDGEDARHYQEKQVRNAIYSRSQQMKPEDRYLKFVRWEDDDQLYVGYCPDLFPWGGVCHAKTEDEAFRQLRVLGQEEVAELQQSGKELPPANTRPMRDAVSA
jgi:predicted RNase H-like HicB family nuclease